MMTKNNLSLWIGLITFIIIRHFVNYFMDRFYQIEKIELNNKNTECFVTFFSKVEKTYIVKKSSEILTNLDLINKFRPIDIAKIAEITASIKYKQMFNYSGQ